MHPHQSPIRRHLDGQGAKVCTKGRLPTSKRENRLRPRSLIGFSCTLPTFPEMFSSRDWGQSSKIEPKHFQPIALQATAKSIVQATADYIAILIIARWAAGLFALDLALLCTVPKGVQCLALYCSHRCEMLCTVLLFSKVCHAFHCSPRCEMPCTVLFSQVCNALHCSQRCAGDWHAWPTQASWSLSITGSCWEVWYRIFCLWDFLLQDVIEFIVVRERKGCLLVECCTIGCFKKVEGCL